VYSRLYSGILDSEPEKGLVAIMTEDMLLCKKDVCLNFQMIL
jgi:hypothetical protein